MAYANRVRCWARRPAGLGAELAELVPRGAPELVEGTGAGALVRGSATLETRLRTRGEHLSACGGGRAGGTAVQDRHPARHHPGAGWRRRSRPTPSDWPRSTRLPTPSTQPHDRGHLPVVAEERGARSLRPPHDRLISRTERGGRRGRGAGGGRRPVHLAADRDGRCGRPAWCQGEESPPPGVAELMAEPGIISRHCPPSKDRLIGSLNLAGCPAEAFSSWIWPSWSWWLRHVAIALDNARLLEAVAPRPGVRVALKVGRSSWRPGAEGSPALITRSGTGHGTVTACRCCARATTCVAPRRPGARGGERLRRKLATASGWASGGPAPGRPDMRPTPASCSLTVERRSVVLGAPLRRGAGHWEFLEVVSKERALRARSRIS